MDDIVRAKTAEAVSEDLDGIKVAIIKGMLKRGDRQSDIAAFFKFNGRVVSHINRNRYEQFAHIEPALPARLPPADYPSPYELLEAQQGMWRVRVALERALETVRDALDVVHKAESHGPVKKDGKR